MILTDVTLVVTVLNENASIAGWLGSLESQTSLPSCVIICDGGSTDGTVQAIERAAAGISVPVKVISAPGANISAGRNAAIAEVKTPWVAVTDAGTTLDAEWLQRLYKGRREATMVGGFFRPEGKTLFERVLGAVITPLVTEIREADFLPSSRSLLIRKELWELVGGYPEWLDYCEDLVFDISMVKAGARRAFVPDAIVSWVSRPNLKSFFKQYYRYARGDGKAGLWPKRHLIRYFSYVIGLALVSIACIAGSYATLIIVGIGTVAYLRKPVWRIMRHDALRPRDRLLGLPLVPAIVVVGDAAKMVGYPAGLAWRRRNEA